MSSFKNKAQGKFHEVKGEVLQKAGEISRNPKLQVKGAVDVLKGKAQQTIGEAQKEVSKKLKEVSKKIKK